MFSECNCYLVWHPIIIRCINLTCIVISCKIAECVNKLFLIMAWNEIVVMCEHTFSSLETRIQVNCIWNPMLLPDNLRFWMLRRSLLIAELIFPRRQWMMQYGRIACASLVLSKVKAWVLDYLRCCISFSVMFPLSSAMASCLTSIASCFNLIISFLSSRSFPRV